MIAVIFEVIPNETSRLQYFDIAKELVPELKLIKGFISIERFQSLADPQKILSLSFWESEESIGQWRNNQLHRAAQKRGRENIFTDYRLRIADVCRDYGMVDRRGAPADSKIYHTVL